MWNGSPCDRDDSDYATANGLASPNDEYEYSAPLHTALAPEVNFLGIHGWGFTLAGPWQWYGNHRIPCGTRFARSCRRLDQAGADQQLLSGQPPG